MTDVISKVRDARAGRARALLERAGYADGGVPSYSKRLGVRNGYVPEGSHSERSPTSGDVGVAQLGSVVGAIGDDQGRTRDPRDDAAPLSEVAEPERRGGKVRKLGRRHAKKARGGAV